MKPRDYKDRYDIINDYNNSIICSAAAGSGKTTSMVQRMVKMVESGIDISKICAITFTKAASREFYDRFYKKLLQRSDLNYNSDPKNSDEILLIGNVTEDSKAKCIKALSDFDKCFLGTIDSFCNEIIKENSKYVGVPSNLKVYEDNDFNNEVKIAFLDYIENETDKEILDAYEEFKNVTYNPIEDICTYLKLIFNNIENNIKTPYFECGYSKYINDLYNTLEYLRTNANFFKEVLSIDETYKIDERKEIAKYIHVLDSNSWKKDFITANKLIKIIFKEHTIDHIKYKSTEKFPIAKKSMISSLLKNCYYIDNGAKTQLIYPAEYLELFIKIKFAVSLHFALLIYKNILEKLKNKGISSFHLMLYYLREALKKDITNTSHPLITSINNKYEYYHLDEAQDTDPLQMEVFFYITTSNFKDNWLYNLPKPGHLYICGDEKQSIYKFKGADVTNFNNVLDYFKKNTMNNCKVCKLTENFRSTGVLKEYFNNTFNTLFQNDSSLDSRLTKEQVAYTPVDSSPILSCDEPGVYYLPYEDIKTIYEDIAKYITLIVNNSSYKVSKPIIQEEDKQPELNLINYSDIMIIDHGKNNLWKYKSIFDLYHIPYRFEGLVDFSECKILHTVYHLFEYVSSHSKKDLAAGINDFYPTIILKDLKGYFDKIIGKTTTEFDKLLKLFTENYYKFTPSQLMEFIYNEVNIQNIIDQKDIELYFNAVELVKQKENDGEILSFMDASDYLKDLLLNNVVERSFGLENNENKVLVANLHKVKGLEAKVVILGTPRLMTKYSDSFLDHAKHDVYFVKINDSNTNSFPNESELVKKSDDLELKRLLYVAATRAGNILVISKKVRGSSNTWYPLLNDNITNLALTNIESNEQDNIDKTNKENVDSSEDKKTGKKDNTNRITKEYVDLSNNIQNTYSTNTPSENESSTKSKEEIVKSDDSTIIDKTNLRGDIFGKMVHELMQKLVESKNSYVKDDLINNIVNSYDVSNKQDYTDALTKIYDNVINNGYDDILNTLLNAKELYLEVPYSFEEVTIIHHGIIDVLYLDNDDKWHIRDYKTDEVLDKSKYTDQQESYKSAVEKILGITITDWELVNIK